MYTVKQVVALTGITAARLRAWERRYNVVTPRRTDTSYRMFSEEDVQRLRTMVQLVDSGVTAHAAARIVLESPLTIASSAPGTTPAEFADVAAALDGPRLEAILDDVVVLDGFESICDNWVVQALDELGKRRRAGDLLDVHLQTAGRALEQRFCELMKEARALESPWKRRNQSPPTVLIAQQEASASNLPALAFAVALRRNGVDSRFLGHSISESGWQHAIRQLRPRALTISSVTTRGRNEARRLADLFARPTLRVWLGGRGHDVSDPGVLPMNMLGATHEALTELWGGVKPPAA